MEPKVKTNNDGPVDETKENKPDNQNVESSQPHNLQLVAKEKEPHPTHSFKWHFNGRMLTSVTCDKAGTVEDALKISSQFRAIAKKHSNKELVILREKKAISSHFPCSLIKDACLTVKYVKTVARPKQPGSGAGHHRRKGSSGELVMFHVLTKGGKNVTKIMRNPALKTGTEITVYAYKGEKVKHALKRDARFLSTVFSRNCALFDTSAEVNTEMSNLVDDLDGKTFQIILLDKCSPPHSQSSSLDDAYIMSNESQRSDYDENQNLSQQSTTAESVNDNAPQVNANMVLIGIPGSKMMQCQLSQQFKHLVKGMKTVSKPSRVQNLLRVEYGKNTETCTEVKTMKKLMDLSNSVCHVRINGRPEGTGFLLFDKYVLTNGHVLKNVYNENRGQLDEKVTVHFSYESLDQTERGQESGAEVEVEAVAGYEFFSDVSGHIYDWALLRLSSNQKLPEILLTRFGFLPHSGGVCIIGHPYGGVKKIDPCLIIPSDNRNQVVEEMYHENQGVIHLVTRNFFENVAEDLERNRQVLTYKTCFYSGSSGSPVFDEHCKVVAMHSGGFPYYNSGKLESVVEFGYPLSNIIEHILVQLVDRQRFDVLKAYLACDYAHQQNTMSSVKKLVESRNLTAFKNALSSPVVKRDQSLRMFFEFFSQKEEPVPMEIC